MLGCAVNEDSSGSEDFDNIYTMLKERVVKKGQLKSSLFNICFLEQVNNFVTLFSDLELKEMIAKEVEEIKQKDGIQKFYVRNVSLTEIILINKNNYKICISS